jgi:transcriptional regulator with XRE-family HTH domain
MSYTLNVGRNIRFLRKQQGLTLEDLASMSGMDPSNLSKIERGIGGFSIESVARIKDALRVSEGTMFSDHLTEEDVVFSCRPIPVLAGSELLSWNLETAANYVPKDLKKTVFVGPSASTGAFAIRVDSDDMGPLFAEGDHVIFKPTGTVKPGEFVLAVIDSDLTIFRQYKLSNFSEPGKQIVELLPLNSFYPKVSSVDHEVGILGIMEEHRRYPSGRKN